MKQLFFILLTFTTLYIQAQNFIYKKIAQRRDDYVNNAWKGKDSFLFAYNNDTLQTSLQALQFSANNTWDNWYRYTYTLNGQGKVSAQLRENWNAGNWVNSTLYDYTFDSSGNNIEIVYSVWGGNSWLPTGKISYTAYNNYGNYQNEYVYIYSGGNWINQSWKKISYVNNQTLTQDEDRYTWDIPSNSWKKVERLYYTYTQGEISSITRSVPDSIANWAPKDKYTYNYNLAPLQLLEYVTQKYDTLLLNWANISRVTYSYTGNNLLENTQNEIYANQGWNATARAQYIYNGNNEKAEYYTELYNGGWNKDARSTYSYNNGLVAEENQFAGVGNNWVQNKKLSYTYDANENLTYELNESYAGGIITPFSRAFYYYHAFPVNVEDRITAFSKLVLYPNPANDKINILFDAEKNTNIQINILDIYGKNNLIMAQPVIAAQNHIQVPCESLSNGFYFAQIIDLQTGRQQIEKFQVNR